MRRPKTNRVPRTRAGGEWTEAAFWGFIRSHLRLLSRRWPPRAQHKRNRRRPFKGGGRQKWEYQCVVCKDWFADKETELDHIEPVGQLKSFDDVGPFLERLLCEEDGFEIRCKACHLPKSRMRRHTGT